MALASVFFCAMGGLVKCGSYIGVYKIAFFRFLIGLAMVVVVARMARVKLVFHSKWMLFFRGLTGGIAIFITILSVTKLGLGKGIVLICSYPIFASIIGAVFLKERLRLVDIIAIAAAMVGIYFIAYEKQAGVSLSVFGKYELLAVMGAMFAGIAVVLIRKLHDTDDSWAIYFAQCAVGVWLVVVPTFGSKGTIDFKAVFILLGIGATVTAGQLLMTEGFKYVPVKTGCLLLMLDPVLCYVAGVAIFGEPLTVSAMTGAVLVIGACTVVLAGRKRANGIDVSAA